MFVRFFLKASLRKTNNVPFFDKNSVYAETIYGYLNKEMMLAIKIGSPALLIIFMTDLFLGISNRLAPQVQITFLGLPLKAFCGLLVIWLGLRVILKQLDIELDEWLVGFKNMTHWIRYGIP